MTAIRILTSDDLDSARAIRLWPDQRGLVASIDEELADATEHTEFLGVWAQRTLVGFMLGEPGRRAERGSYLIWGFRIDRDHQRRGHGRAGLLAAIDRARSLGAARVGLACDRDNHVAHQLYRSLGFRDTGIVNSLDERELVYPLA